MSSFFISYLSNKIHFIAIVTILTSFVECVNLLKESAEKYHFLYQILREDFRKWFENYF